MDFFPLNIASGKAFCNRKQELAYLGSNIEQAKPTLLISPRRYGKTSLALNAITQSKKPFAHIDFLSAINEEDIEKKVLKGAGELISKIEPGIRKAIKLATDLFSGLDIKVNFGKIGIAIDLARPQNKPSDTILLILDRIAYLSQKYDKKVVLFFDEFQRLGEVTADHAIESVMREVAQKSKNIMFIFSGSTRHLLHQMFDDRNKPFYKLCDRMVLDRIAAVEYTKYIQHAAKLTWSESLDTLAIDAIMQCTERHPYYVNLLCSKLWKHIAPDRKQVIQIWQDYVIAERSQVANDVELLSKNQRKLLSVLARFDGTDAPRSREFEQKADMSGTSIGQALAFLEKYDFVFKNEIGCYSVLDPLVKAVLAGE